MLTTQESELISAYLDEELNGEEWTKVRERLISLPEWKIELKKLKSLKSLTQELPDVEAPPELISIVQRQCDEKFKRRRDLHQKSGSFSWKWGLTGGLAAAAMIVAAVFGVRTWQAPAVSSVPAEILLVAHAGQGMDGSFYNTVVSASDYSSEIKNHHEKN